MHFLKSLAYGIRLRGNSMFFFLLQLLRICLCASCRPMCLWFSSSVCVHACLQECKCKCQHKFISKLFCWDLSHSALLQIKNDQWWCMCARAHKQTCMRTGCAKRRGGSAFWLLLLFQFLFVSDGDSIPCSPHTASFVLTLAFLLSLSPFSLYLSIFSFLSSSLSFVILPFSDFKCRLPPVIPVYFPLFSVIPFIIVHCLFSVVDCMQ